MRLIGADWLVYQDLDELLRCSRDGNPRIEDFECSVFNGVYVTGDVGEDYLERLHTERNDAAKFESPAADGDGVVVGIHNDISEAV